MTCCRNVGPGTLDFDMRRAVSWGTPRGSFAAGDVTYVWQELRRPVVWATHLERSLRVAAIANTYTVALDRRDVLKWTKSAPGVRSMADSPSSNDQREYIEPSSPY